MKIPKSKQTYWNIAESDTSATLTVYGPISSDTWWDDDVVSASDFYKSLQTVSGKHLDVRINSGGGDVYEAQAIHNLLKAHNGGVDVYIDGLCCSAATLIACAGDTVTMPSNAVYMIHNPSTGAWGDAEALTHAAERLAVVKETILNVYVARVGEDKREELVQLMDNETWFTAEEALAYGLVDSISTEYIENCYKDGQMFMNNVGVTAPREKVAKFLNERKTMDVLDQIKALLGMEPVENKAKTEEPVNTANVADEAVQAERDRVAALDAMKTGEPMVDALVERAKMDGMTAEQMQNFVNDLAPYAKEAEENKKRVAAIVDMIKDSAESGAEKVNAEPKAVANETVDNSAQDLDSLVKMANELRGVK